MPSTLSGPSTARTDHAGDVIVAAQGLTKIFKDFWHRDRARAVDGIDFQIDRGEIFGLLGPNGSGKSTTIKIILGLLKKTKGRLLVFGRAPSDVAIKKRIGYLPEESYLYPFLNARETLEYYAKLFQLDYRTRAKRIDELLEMVGLEGVQHRQIREYSKGMQRRIGIAQALINDPEFLILDEPTTGLDPIGTRQVKDLILELGQRGKTVLLSSHLLADVEDCVDRMVILYGGKIRAEGTCGELLEADERSIIETDELDEDTITEIRAVLERHQHTLNRVSRPRQKLEELFVGIVERARSEQVATSGALGGGGTAAFLRGDAAEDAADGEALIDRLTRHEAGAMELEEPPATPSRDEPEVIRELLDEPEAEESPKAASPTSSSGPEVAGSDRDVEIDQSVISSLLGDEDGDDSSDEGSRR